MPTSEAGLQEQLSKALMLLRLALPYVDQSKYLPARKLAIEIREVIK